MAASGDWGVTLRNISMGLVEDALAAGLHSNYRLAKFLGVNAQTVGNMRKGRYIMSDKNAVKIAQYLKRAPAPVLVQLAIERAANDAEVAKVWRDVAKLLPRV